MLINTLRLLSTWKLSIHKLYVPRNHQIGLESNPGRESSIEYVKGFAKSIFNLLNIVRRSLNWVIPLSSLGKAQLNR